MSRTEAAGAGGTRRKTVALAVPIAGLAASLFLPPVLAGLPVAGQRALIVTLITILLWTGEILEPGVAALVGVTLLALSGATASLRDALQGFANPVPFFLIGVLTMGVAVVRSGLGEDEQDDFADWLYDRVVMFAEVGGEADGWDRREDGTWQVSARR